MTLADYKLQVFREIMQLENEYAIKQLYNVVHTFIEDFQKIKEKEKYLNQSFEQWNKQFTDNQNLDTFIPEYGTSLREFRKGIYDAEIGETIPLNVFQQKLRKIYEKT